MLQIDKQAQDGVSDVLKVIHGDPTLKIMWENMAPSDQAIMKRSLESSLKNTIQKAKGDKIQVTPDVKVIISYPENIYMTEPYLQLDWGLEKIYIMRYSINFEQQVRNAAKLRNIEILEFKTKEKDAEPTETPSKQNIEQLSSSNIAAGTPKDGGNGSNTQSGELSLFQKQPDDSGNNDIGL